MTVYPLVIAPDPRLKQRSSEVEEVTDEIRDILDNMLETMYASNGIGLAAVQVGIMQRIVVVDVDRPSDRYPDQEGKTEANPIFLVNPEVINISEDLNTYEEGCLSFPGQYSDVVRPEAATIRYLDYNGIEKELEADNLLATCIQHEIDHLDGVVFVDHISRMKRDMIMRKLKKQHRQNM